MDKVFSVLKWFSFMLIYGLLYPLAYLIYPISYRLRHCLRRVRYQKRVWWYIVPLWVFLDDEEDYGEGEPAWFESKKGDLSTGWGRFRMAYLWSVTRNHAWNFHSLSGLHKGQEKELVSTKGEITRRDKVVEDPYVFATFRYEDDNGNWTGHKGKWLSYRHSDFGKRFTWYKIGKRLFWRYSFANYVEWMGRWVELHLGSTDNRYTIRFKIKNVTLKTK